MDFLKILNLYLEGSDFINETISQLKKYFNTDNMYLLDVNLIQMNYKILVNGNFNFDTNILFTKTTECNCIKIIDNNESYVFFYQRKSPLIVHGVRKNSDEKYPTLFPELRRKASSGGGVGMGSGVGTGSGSGSRSGIGFVEIEEFTKLITPLFLNYRQKTKQVSLGTTLMSNISHEIRTPLNGIITTSKLLSETPLNEMQKDYMNIVMSSCVQLLGLVNDILDISKLENNKLTLTITSFSLRELIEECMEMTRDKIFDKNLDINLFINLKYDIIMNDRRRLMQIIINLIYNAIKFTEKGNIIITANIIENNIIIDIKDTGIGISEIDKHKLFKPFTQLDSSSSKSYEGTGLGLAISKMLCNLMGGDLNLHSSEFGKGSIFRVMLPYREGIIEFTYEDFSILNGKHCLVVDDNETNRDHIAKILDEVNMTYTLASSGQETLLIYGTETKLDKFDFYIIDIRMPHMNGNILIEKLLRIKPKPCISLNSGIDTPSNLFNTNLQKPIIRKKLLKALAQFKPTIDESSSIEFIPSLQTPKGVDILIAEDNKINQDVILKVLASLN
jgi:CheY-like chemotaxis protein